MQEAGVPTVRYAIFQDESSAIQAVIQDSLSISN